MRNEFGTLKYLPLIVLATGRAGCCELEPKATSLVTGEERVTIAQHVMREIRPTKKESRVLLIHSPGT